MRFTFGTTHIVSKILYLVGIPVVLIMVLDRTLNWQLVSETHNLQLFFLGAILVTIGGVINLSVTIWQNFRR